MSALALLLALMVAGEGVTVSLKDGRRLHGKRLVRSEGAVVLVTDFDSLVIPADRIGPRPNTPAAKAPPPGRRTLTLRWFRLTTDMSEERVRLYRDVLDPFFGRLLEAYGLDKKRVVRLAPFRLDVFRSRADFKRVQDTIGAGIEQRKGKAFAEGVTGFYSPPGRAVFMWDASGWQGDFHLEVLRHEVTHLANHLLSDVLAIRVPPWFEEGCAVYFSTPWVGKARPELHLASLYLVTRGLEAKRALGNSKLRRVPYDIFYAREYAWGWALVHFLREHARGKAWPRVLDSLRSASRGASADRRFLKAAGFRSLTVFDRAWHRFIAKLDSGQAAGAAAHTLDALRTLKKPSAKRAEHFARMGQSLLAKGLAEPARVYLQAAIRGGVDNAVLRIALARAIAQESNAAEDEVWPPEAVGHLEQAVGADPLDSTARALLGQQLLAASKPEKAWRQLGLALVLVGSADDGVGRASAALAAGSAAWDFKRALARLRAAAPHAAGWIHKAAINYLQAEQEFDELKRLLEQRLAGGKADFDDRRMLADLFCLTDRLDRAADLYKRLLEEKPDAMELWLPYIKALRDAGRLEAARTAKATALRRMAADRRDWGVIRQQVEAVKL